MDDPPSRTKTLLRHLKDLLSGWFNIHRVTDAPQDTPARATATAWIAAMIGAACLVAVLYLALGNHALSAALREEPLRVLLLGALIFLGGSAIFASRHMKSTTLAPVPMAAILLGLILVSGPLAVGNLANAEPSEARAPSLIVVVAAVALAFFFIFRSKDVGLGALLLSIGVLLLTLGVYGTAQLTIALEKGSVAAQIGATSIVRKEDGLLHLTSTVAVDSLMSGTSVCVRAGNETLADMRGGTEGRAEVPIDAIVSHGMVADDSIDLTASIEHVDNDPCWSGQPTSSLQKSKVRVHIPSALNVPVLSAEWLDDRVLKVTATSPDATDHKYASIVVAGRTSKTCRLLAFALVPIDMSGRLSYSLLAQVPPYVRIVEIRGGIGDHLTPTPDPACCASLLGAPSAAVVILQRGTAATH